MTKVSISSLLDAGAHFGHQTRRWNPKMRPYIFGSRGDIYILDLKQTLIGMDKAYSFVSELARKGGTILFVGTKKQAQEPIADAANRCGMPYVNARWLGGMLTNFATIRTRVDYMEELEAMEADGRIAALPKKEQISLRKKLAKLQTNLNGIRNMKRVPEAIFVIDTNREYIAVREAKRLGLPVIGTLDTNCDPDDVDYGIPANDDAIRSVALLADFIADAVIAGTGADVTASEMAGEDSDTRVQEDSDSRAEEDSDTQAEVDSDTQVEEDSDIRAEKDADTQTIEDDQTHGGEEVQDAQDNESAQEAQDNEEFQESHTFVETAAEVEADVQDASREGVESQDLKTDLKSGRPDDKVE